MLKVTPHKSKSVKGKLRGNRNRKPFSHETFEEFKSMGIITAECEHCGVELDIYNHNVINYDVLCNCCFDKIYNC